MIRQMLNRIFGTRPQRSLTLKKALEHVSTIGAYADMLAAAPVASTDVPPDVFQTFMSDLLEDLSPSRLPKRIRQITRFPQDTGSIVEVTWMQSILGIRLSRRDVQIAYGENHFFSFPLPTAFQGFAGELAEYLGEDATSRSTRETLQVAKALSMRLHLAFDEMIRRLTDVRLRARYDAVLVQAETAASCVAAAIEAERPGSMGSIYVNLEKSIFLADILYSKEADPAELRFPIDVPTHIAAMLPGYAILVASIIRNGPNTTVYFEDNWLESPPVSDDPIQLIRLARLHGTGVTYGAALDTAYADADSQDPL